MTAGPLASLRVRVTRPAEQAAPLLAALAALGAEVSAGALIEFAAPADPEPLDAALRELAAFDVVAFASVNAVAAVAARLRTLGLTARPRLAAAVGTATAAAVREHFPGVALVVPPPAAFHAEGLVAALAAHGVGGRRVLIPASDRARPALATGLRATGALVTAVVAYRTLAATQDAATAEAAAAIDLVVLASPSAAQAWSALGAHAMAVPAAVIGPVTEAAAREAGLAVAAVASPSTNEGLVAAIAAWAAATRG